jgi:hypothetical protein
VADDRWTRLPLPPGLKMPEHVGDADDTFQRIRKRFGLLEDYLDNLFAGLVTLGTGDTCDCFRWIYQVIATVDEGGGAQVNFVLPANCELEDNEYQLVVARSSFEYHNAGYTITEATNTITFIPGILLGECVIIYALKHDDVQEVYYETVAIPAVPYTYSPPVLVDRGAGRQLVLARNSMRFLDSGRNPDEYTVSNTLNTLSLTAGLGPIGSMSAMVRLRECGVLWHEEILATALGQTVFTPGNPGNVVNDHSTMRMIVTQRTSLLHPGFDFVTNPGVNTITINAPGLAIGQPLNVWMYR